MQTSPPVVLVHPAAEGEDELARRRELLDPGVGPVEDEEVAARVDRDPGRLIELAGASAFEAGQAGRAGGRRPRPAGLQFRRSVPDAPAPGLDELAPGGELVDPAGPGFAPGAVDHEDVPAGGTGDQGPGPLELPRPGSPFADLGEEGQDGDRGARRGDAHRARRQHREKAKRTYPVPQLPDRPATMRRSFCRCDPVFAGSLPLARRS